LIDQLGKEFGRDEESVPVYIGYSSGLGCDDFIDGLLAASTTGDQHLVINICAGQGYSIREILDTLLRVDGFDNADVQYDLSKPSTIPVRLMDNAKAKTVLNFEARVPLEEGFRRTLAWYRAHPFVEPGA